MQEPIYDIPVTHIDGKNTTLKEYAGQVLLVVNVASKCGLTPQYEALESLHERWAARGLRVLGFPANEFGAQEPGTNAEIAEFCQSNFGVKFPMFQKIAVKGKDIHPLYRHLTSAQPKPQGDSNSPLRQKLAQFAGPPERANDILWNFEKFLVNRKGQVVARFAPDVSPEDKTLLAALEGALKEAS
jgi:glutathione peroxidase